MSDSIRHDHSSASSESVLISWISDHILARWFGPIVLVYRGLIFIPLFTFFISVPLAVFFVIYGAADIDESAVSTYIILSALAAMWPIFSQEQTKGVRDLTPLLVMPSIKSREHLTSLLLGRSLIIMLLGLSVLLTIVTAISFKSGNFELVNFTLLLALPIFQSAFVWFCISKLLNGFGTALLSLAIPCIGLVSYAKLEGAGDLALWGLAGLSSLIALFLYKSAHSRISKMDWA